MHALATVAARWVLRALIAVLAFGGAGPVAAMDWQVEISPADELFPALQLSQSPRVQASTPGGGDGLVSVRIGACTNARACADAPRRVHLRIDMASLRAPAIVEAERDPHAILILRPRLEWDVSALRGRTTPWRERVRIELNGRERAFDVRVHPLEDAVYFVREGADQVDLAWAFAGYVTPRSNAVDEVLALARAIDPAFGHPRGAAAPTGLDLAATIWAALERHGMRYARGNPALSQGPALYSQRVRLPDATWRERRANCIDGSVLIASVFERIGVPSAIVLVPGHAFVRFEARAGEMRYLETTVLGASSPNSTFEAALAAGTAHWRRVRSRFDSRHAPDYALVDIETARAYGIIALAAGADAPARSEEDVMVTHRRAGAVAVPDRR